MDNKYDNPRGRYCECGHHEDVHTTETSDGNLACVWNECLCKGFAVVTDSESDRMCLCGHVESCHGVSGSIGVDACVNEDCACVNFVVVPAPVENGRLCACGHLKKVHVRGKLLCPVEGCECTGVVSMTDEEPNVDKTGGETPKQSFKVGDPVMLISGGPGMMVVEVRGEHLMCVWFNEAWDLRKDMFLSTTIRLLTDKDLVD